MVNISHVKKTLHYFGFLSGEKDMLWLTNPLLVSLYRNLILNNRIGIYGYAFIRLSLDQMERKGNFIIG